MLPFVVDFVGCLFWGGLLTCLGVGLVRRFVVCGFGFVESVVAV